MLALRLIRAAHLAVQLRRFLVTVASAGTGFLLLCALGHAMSHPDAPGPSALRLAWCAAPLTATVYLAVAVARADPGARPRPGLSAVGLGPGRLMAVSATATALAGALGSALALLLFLHLRGDLTGRPLDGTVPDALAVGLPLPFPAALTLLALVPATASAAVALTLRPREARPVPATRTRGYGRFGAYGWSAARETFGAYGRFGARQAPAPARGEAARPDAGDASPEEGTLRTRTDRPPARAATDVPRPAPDAGAGPRPTTRPQNSTTLPWGIAVLTAGLSVESCAGNTAAPAPGTTASAGVLIGWALTALGLALAGPGLTHLCGRVLQAGRPGALRLLAGRVLMEESSRIGRPLGVVCAVASVACTAALLYESDGAALGPLSSLGALLVAGCAVATLLTAAVETKQARTDTTQALLRLGAPRAVLRGAAAVRAGSLLVLFGPLTLIVAALASLPLIH
ncbi:hypothetical protein [Streptomyces sp. AC627_RSS907]|uniref:hypothetical protein n=1 Tax=Streptomyces sp. AC627_RSS907 TaxID=2823684 RepID=UPI001C21AE89|nr:hypothetical protein [Streptomyces sp. AC627_RSS907]